jgi:RNA polymerase sigma factor (sigma-70 family)
MDIENDNYGLAQKACGGDLEALSELIERTRARLFGLAYAELRHYEDAQDVVVAALHQICRHIDQLEEPQCVTAWMNSIVRNEVRQLRRRFVPITTSMNIDEPDYQMEQISSCLLRIDIEQALRNLPQDQARVIELFYWQHLSTHEIAAQLKRPEGSVRRWLHLGRRQLAVELGRDGSDSAYRSEHQCASTFDEGASSWRLSGADRSTE